MKALILIASLVLAGASGAAVENYRLNRFTADPQVASGEWKIEMNHPPCDSVYNLEVIWPADGHEDQPISIECNSMPVGEK